MQSSHKIETCCKTQSLKFPDSPYQYHRLKRCSWTHSLSIKVCLNWIESIGLEIVSEVCNASWPLGLGLGSIGKPSQCKKINK